MGLLDTGRDLRRLNELTAVLLKYGFGDLISRFGLAGFLEQAGRLMRLPVDREVLERGPGERMRHALEEMGPTFVKLGQILATRVDLFPPDWIAEFEQLQDQARPIPWETLRPRVEKSLGRPLEEIFASVEPEPIGVASIAQVHRAVLRDGGAVALKIRKPGIRGRIESDLRLLEQAARLAADHSTELRRYHPVDLVREFDQSLVLKRIEMLTHGHGGEPQGFGDLRDLRGSVQLDVVQHGALGGCGVCVRFHPPNYKRKCLRISSREWQIK